MGRIVALVSAGVALLVVVPFAFSGHTTEAGGVPVLIKTKMRVIIPLDENTPPSRGQGNVLAGSFLGDRPFCRGGEFRDALRGAPPDVTVTRRFRCEDGTLRIRFKPRSPSQENLNQSGLWRVLGGTGRYANLRPGHGSVFARFDKCCPTARETFTGTVANK